MSMNLTESYILTQKRKRAYVKDNCSLNIFAAQYLYNNRRQNIYKR